MGIYFAEETNLTYASFSANNIEPDNWFEAAYEDKSGLMSDYNGSWLDSDNSDIYDNMDEYDESDYPEDLDFPDEYPD